VITNFSITPQENKLNVSPANGGNFQPAKSEREADDFRASTGLLVINGGIVSPPPKKAENGTFERLNRRFRLQDVARKLLPSEAIQGCLRWRYNVTRAVGVQYVADKKSSHFSNLQTCGLPWVCPVCAAKISERRRVELRAGVESWKQKGGIVFLVTLTMQHKQDEKIKDLLNELNSAYRSLRSGMPWQRFEFKYGLVGSVASHEITYSQHNGFHPHKHILFFSDASLTKKDYLAIEIYLTLRWKKVLSRFGRSALNGIGVDVQQGYGAVGDYVAKWGLVEEVTKSNSKTGTINSKADHYSPFQLLDLVAEGSSWAGEVFREYAKATKYKNQLTWSPGLRLILGLGIELTDLEVAELQEKHAVTLIELLFPQWQKVLKLRARAVLLEVASTGRADLVKIYLKSVGVLDLLE